MNQFYDDFYKLMTIYDKEDDDDIIMIIPISLSPSALQIMKGVLARDIFKLKDETYATGPKRQKELA